MLFSFSSWFPLGDNNYHTHRDPPNLLLLAILGMVSLVSLGVALATVPGFIDAIPNVSFRKASVNSTNSTATNSTAGLSRVGVLQKAGVHELNYNNDARLASKQFYELLSDANNTYYDEKNGILGTTFFSENVYSRQPFVANGYIGSRITNVGLGFALDTSTVAGNRTAEALENTWPEYNRRYAGSFVSDFYALEPHLTKTNFPEIDEKGYPSIIASLPDWTDLQFLVTNSSNWFNALNVTADQVTNYSQNMSMENGIVTTAMDWLDGQFHVRSQIIAHREVNPVGIVTLDIELNVDKLPANFTDVTLEFFDIFNHSTSVRTFLQNSGFDSKNNGIFMVVQPDNVPYNNAALFSTAEIEVMANDGSIIGNNSFAASPVNLTDGYSAQSATVTLTKTNTMVHIKKFVGVMSSTYSMNNSTNLDVAAEYATDCRDGNFTQTLLSHNQAWEDLYNGAKIEIPSDSLLELTARSSMYQLLANSRPNNVSLERGLQMTVGGLSSDSYAGYVFWDADMWVAPAMLPFAPKVAKNINSYRNATHHQALLNAKEYGYKGALYPWTSDGFSNCSSTGPCVDYEYHINIDVAFSTLTIFLSGATSDLNEEYLRYTTWPMVKDAADFFTSYVKKNQTTGLYETHNLTDPDEFANHVDNGAFTNTGIRTLLKWATDIGNHLKEPVDSKWKTISEHMTIPRAESNITLEYTGMNNTAEIKQADVALMVYPLDAAEDPISAAYAIKDLYYYSGKQASRGPAMTYPVFVAGAQSLFNHGSASQSYLYKTAIPYLRMPFAQFSEGSDDNYTTNGGIPQAFPFLTGNGGYLQAIIFGLTGIRYTYDVDNSTKKMERILKFDPTELRALPDGIAIRNFQYMQNSLDFIINDTNGTIVHKSGNTTITIKVPNRDRFNDSDIQLYSPSNNTLKRRSESPIRVAEDGSGIYYTLAPGQELVVPVYKTALTVPGNLAEARQIANLTNGVAGDVGLSAIDGNNFTHWQPQDKNTAKLLIDLGSEHQINKGFIDWGTRPAKNISISVLPYSEILDHLFSNVTYILENSNGTYNDAIESAMSYLENAASTANSTNGTCSSDISSILNWKLGEYNSIISALPNIPALHEQFVNIVDDQKVKPSLPYYDEVDKDDLVVLLPGNITEFSVDYSNIQFNNSLSCLSGAGANDWKLARYVIVSVEGTYDNDTNPYGATINEIVLQ